VTNEFVGPTQTVFIENLLVIEHNGILDSPPECQPGSMKGFDFMGKTEGSRRSEFPLEELLIEVRQLEALAADAGMIEVDRIGNPQFFSRIDSDRSIPLTDLDRLIDRKLSACAGLGRPPRAAQTFDERCRTAIHRRNLGSGNLDTKIVDLESEDRGEEMLDGGHLASRTHSTPGGRLTSIGDLGQGRRAGRRVDGLDAGGYLDIPTRIRLAAAPIPQRDENDPGVGITGAEGDFDFFAAMESDPMETDPASDSRLRRHGPERSVRSLRGQDAHRPDSTGASSRDQDRVVPSVIEPASD